MDFPSKLYSENFDSIGEESFQPDYYELDDDGNSTSAVLPPSSAPVSGQCTPVKKIIIKKPPIEKLPVLEPSRRKRPWKSSSHADAASSISTTSFADKTRVVESVRAEVNTHTTITEAPACQQSEQDLNVLISDDLLVGDG